MSHDPSLRIPSCTCSSPASASKAMADFDDPVVDILPGRREKRRHSHSGVRRNHRKEDDFAKNVNFGHQFVALFLKDLTSQLKSVGTNLCQVFVPIVLISFTGIIQVVMNYLIHKNGGMMPGSNTPQIPADVSRIIPCTRDDLTGFPEDCYDPVINYALDFDGLKWMDKLYNINNVSQLLINISVALQFHFINGTLQQDVLFDLPYYYIGKYSTVHLPLGESSTEGLKGLMVPADWRYNFSLDFTINPNYTNRFFNENIVEDGNYVELPFFVPIEWNSTKELQKHLLAVVRDYNLLASTSSASEDQYNRNYVVNPQSQAQYNTTLENIQKEEFNKTKPHGGIFFTHFKEDEESVELKYTVIGNEITLYTIHLDVFGMSLFAEQKGSLNIEIQRRNGMINMVHNGIFKYLNNESGISESPNIVTYVMPLPPDDQKLTIDITNILGGLLYPFSASFLFPIFIAALVKDKQEKHLIMMEQNGLQRTTYWVITYIFNYLLYIIIAIVISVVSVIWQIRLFTQTSVAVVFLVFWLWGHSQVVLGFFFSNFFNSPRTATIVGYIFVIAGVMVALLLEILQVFPDDKTPFPLYMIYPPFAFYRILFYMIAACGNYQCYNSSILSGLNLMTTAILYLGFSTIVLMFLAFYLSYVLPSEYGVRKSPFFPIIGLYHGLLWVLRKAGLRKKKQLGEDLPSARSKVTTSLDMEDVGIDDDVVAEDERLGKGFPPDSPVVIYKLRKEYPSTGGRPPHVAVKSFSLAIDRNECFGLLGPNGAGKTTLISVLTGLYEPSSGTARIAGFDLKTEINSIHHHLGVCPQFDIQYPNLTCEEHLLFYARLKGAKIGRTGGIVKRALEQVNLYNARKKRSKNLSGGMRRRLSVAMACIGSPDILILDEPTTGLDPASRRQVWEVIENIKTDRSVILTTHAMEEADHLCTRIGIMNYGRLCCLGSQSYLKNKFGLGYQLMFHCSPGRASNIERFVQTNLDGATHIETYADTCSYRLDKEKVVVSELFELLDSVRDQIGIVDWGIKMTTLEDVFLNIVRNYGGSESEESSSFCPSWIPCQCMTTMKE